MPLTFEFTLTHDPASWLHTGSTNTGTAFTQNSPQWHLSECYLYYDIITLDPKCSKIMLTS